MKKNYYSNIKFNNKEIVLGFFSRNWGYSKKNFYSLNCSFSSGDKKYLVKKNIENTKKILNLKKTKLKIINQVHSNKVITINKNNFSKKFKGDGMITKDKKISIAILTADCCPVFIYDKDSSFISCLHIGWKGCYKNIIKNAIKKIIKIQPQYKKIFAITGPCLSKKNFEVDINFKNKFQKKHSSYYKFFFKDKIKNKYFFDMIGLINFQLKNNGIKNIENIKIDTYQHKKLFFSHRRSTHHNDLPTGRMINIIGFSK